MRDLSVVIRCRNDPGVLQCIESIDLDAEVIVSFTGNDDLAARIREHGARCVRAPRSNLSRVSNTGFDATTHDKVILTDSDTVFEPMCVGKLRDALGTFRAARARLRFESSHGLSKLVAEARDYVNSFPLLYTPGIAVRKDLLPDVGGFLFNDPVPYAVDADLDFRVKRARVPVAYLTDAWLRHTVVSVRHDLRAAYRIGGGCRISMDHWNRNGSFGPLDRWTLKGVRPSSLPNLLREKGPWVLAYQLLWDSSFWLGFSSTTPGS
jgi:glycosyltransferase involved in cell wall biosynthesis